MLGGVTRHMLPHLPGVPRLHVNRPLVWLLVQDLYDPILVLEQHNVLRELHCMFHRLQSEVYKIIDTFQRSTNEKFIIGIRY